MWIETYWRQDLPFATVPAWNKQTDLIKNLRTALAWAKEERHLMRWSKDGCTAWAKWYKTRRKHTGELGIILKRDRVHILRLAMIFAVLDCREEMTEAHFNAAKAVWDYAEQSARRIFGNSTGNKRADQLNYKLQRKGEMTLTEITREFGNNLPAIERDEIITILVENGSARVGSDTNEKGQLVKVVYAVTSGLN